MCTDSTSHLWAGVSGHQALQLQRASLSDGEHPLSVALLLQAARLPGVEDADSRGRCRGAEQLRRQADSEVQHEESRTSGSKERHENSW